VEGDVRAAGGAMLRCMPKLRPPPIRAASARSLRVSVSAANAARSRIEMTSKGTT